MNKVKLWDTSKWQDRWYLRIQHWIYICKHPLFYFWQYDLIDDEEFKSAAQYKRPICWITNHDWVDVAGSEYWINDSIVGTNYYPVCRRCLKS